MSQTPTNEELVAELKAIGPDIKRIDRLIEDVESGGDRYANLTADELTCLVGLDLDDNADWGHCFLAYRRNLEDDGYDYPHAENIHLLEGQVETARFEELSAKADLILQSDKSNDLELDSKEFSLLKDAYAQSMVDCSDLILISNWVEGSDSKCLEFEAIIGDGGEVSDACTPYELRDGKGLDVSEYIELDN